MWWKRVDKRVPSAEADSCRFMSFPGTYVPGYLYFAALRLAPRCFLAPSLQNPGPKLSIWFFAIEQARGRRLQSGLFLHRLDQVARTVHIQTLSGGDVVSKQL